MKLAIIHHHLNRGGVTQVVVNHLRALDAVASVGDDVEVVIFYGGRREGWPKALPDMLSRVRVSLVEVPSLDYDPDGSVTADDLVLQLEQAFLQNGLTADECLLHVHNHSLGKNAALVTTLSTLAKRGWPLLLQIHDFAEDFRPQNYRYLVEHLASGQASQLPQQLYPQAARIHYAVLNGRDFNVLDRAGIAPTHLHKLPNPVGDFPTLPDRHEAQAKLARHGVTGPLVLYPVRGIRRKNLGEMLLWSALLGEEATVGVTLPPINPIERSQFDRWVEVAARLGLSTRFDLGVLPDVTFFDNLAAADAILTTSVAEGFGMVFLESFLADRSLVGRDLPEITGDFRCPGIDFSHLVERVQVPLAWLARNAFQATIETAYREACQAYGVEPMSSEPLAEQLQSLVVDDCVDFGCLSSESQISILERVCKNDKARDLLRTLNPTMRVSWLGDAAALQAGAVAVRSRFGLLAAGRRLVQLYSTVVESQCETSVNPLPHAEQILQSFLRPTRLHPIRLEQ
jgi:hypothetical protein